MRKKNEKNFGDMEIIGNRRKIDFFQHLQMGKLFSGFKNVRTDFDHILRKRGATIQGRILLKEIQYVKTIYVLICKYQGVLALEIFVCLVILNFSIFSSPCGLDM